MALYVRPLNLIVMKNLSLFVLILIVLPTQLCFSSTRKTIANEDQSYLKTAIEITYPKSSTVWTAPGNVKLEWTTKNIPANKTIKFYLSKDDMVVQELGIFENSQFKYDIPLDRGLPNGNNYRVIGIELFPDDKYNIAKFATALFTINKAPRPQKKVIASVSETSTEQPATAETHAEPKVRESFDGRNINYVNELTVGGEEITISLWDHGRKDGDVVSIYLNGEAIVSKYLLEYQKKVFELKLDPSKANDLFLYAHNLGKFPPNTVSIEITDGTVSENIVLNSDLKSCEAVLINVNK